MNDDIDELDRALFALPLEEPPPGLRQAIFRATIGASARSVTRSLPLGTWEIAGIGSALAVAVWLVLALLGNPGFATVFTLDAIAVIRALCEPATLLWLMAGGAVVAWFTFGNALAESRLTRGRS